jgi:uncharacterized membrane protein YfcA
MTACHNISKIKEDMFMAMARFFSHPIINSFGGGFVTGLVSGQGQVGVEQLPIYQDSTLLRSTPTVVGFITSAFAAYEHGADAWPAGVSAAVGFTLGYYAGRATMPELSLSNSLRH